MEHGEQTPVEALGDDLTALLKRTRETREEAYVPYSDYRVGAVLRMQDGTVFDGHNIEFMMFSDTVHAEKLVVLQAAQAGYRDPADYDCLILSSVNPDGDVMGSPPCGLCLQSMQEFCPPDMTIIADYGDSVLHYKLGNQLPGAPTAGYMQLGGTANNEADQ